MITIMEAINSLIDGKKLSCEDAQAIMSEIMTGKVAETQIASYLTALRICGESSDVIQGSAQSMRTFANKIAPKNASNLVDTCGTGGDGAHTFNISTLAAIIAAGAGVRIAKHGNRAVSSKCGSADILESFGVKVDCEPTDVEKIINKIGVGFMFAPKFHPAMKFAMPVRKSLGMRTIFNILGPLTNPANAPNQILGVFDKAYLKPIAQVLANLNTTHAFVVHSEPHVDEIVPVSKVFISEIKNHEIISETITEKQFQTRFKMEKVKMEEIEGGSPENNTKIAVNILKDREKGAKRQVTVLNAAYAILLGNKKMELDEAIDMANNAIKSGAAVDKVRALVTESNGNMVQFKKVFGE